MFESIQTATFNLFPSFTFTHCIEGLALIALIVFVAFGGPLRLRGE